MWAGAVSTFCIASAALILGVRGSSDWSHSLAVAWWSLLLGGIVLAFVSLGAALFGKSRRRAAAALAVPGLLGLLFLVLLIRALSHLELN
jgi:hypothetical protein